MAWTLKRNAGDSVGPVQAAGDRADQPERSDHDDQPEQGDASRRSHLSPRRRTVVLLVAPIAVLATMGIVGNALTPTLVAKHPLLLIALEARNRNLLLVSTKVAAAPFVVVGSLRRMVSDPLFYVLGYLYGERAVRWMEREVGDRGRHIERFFARAAYPLVFFFPGVPVCVLAGATRMNPWVFGALNLTGTVVVVALLRVVGDVFSGPLGAFDRFLGRNYRWLTAVTIVLTVVWLVNRRRRRRVSLAGQLLATDGAEERAGSTPDTAP